MLLAKEIVLNGQLVLTGIHLEPFLLCQNLKICMCICAYEYIIYMSVKKGVMNLALLKAVK